MAARLKNKKVIRSIKVPPLNFITFEYIDLIKWNDCKLAKPRMLLDLHDEELKKKKKAVPTGKMPDFPCSSCNT